MFFIGKLHPDVAEFNAQDYEGSWLSEKEKRRIIDDFYVGGGRHLPLSFDHRNSGPYGFIAHDDRIGDVVDLYNDARGDLMAKIRLSTRNEAMYQDINAGICDRTVRWGLSVGLAQFTDPNNGERIRELTHVAITPTPGFGDHDTYLYRWHLNEDMMNAAIARDFYRAGEGRAYATPEFEKKLKCM